MKKFYPFLLFVVGLFLSTHNAFAFSGTGTGTQLDPYQISSCALLAEVNNDLSASYTLTTDLDCTANGNAAEIAIWNSIPFNGIFDGDGHTVTVAISENHAGAVGFFSKATGATIRNLRVAGSITGAGADTGGIIGYADNVHLGQVVNTASVRGDGNVGGLVGTSIGSAIANSYNTGAVSGTGMVQGGLVGSLSNTSSITRSYNRGTVGRADESRYHLGGLVGQRPGAVNTIEYSFNVGQVLSAQSTFFFGGLWGNDISGVSSTMESGWTDNFFDALRSTRTMCGYDNDGSRVDPVNGHCQAVNTSGGANDYFKNNSTSAPLDQWDFENIWETNVGGYPTLRVITNDEGPVSDTPTITFDGGDGSSQTPYQISNCGQLQFINNNPDAAYELTGNINCSDTSTWNGGAGFIPLGNDSAQFTGSLNGNGYTISWLTINLPSSTYVGLFGIIGTTGSVYDLGLYHISITGKDKTGGLVGENAGSISQVYVSSGTVAGLTNAGDKTGGFVGNIVNGLITNCYVYMVDVSGGYAVGGFVGQTSGGTISNSYSVVSTVTGNVSAANLYIGGFVGYLWHGLINSSYWDNAVGSSILAGDTAKGVTTSAMKQQTSSFPWDFNMVWDTDNSFNDGYPFLQWQYTPPADTQTETPILELTAGDYVTNAPMHFAFTLPEQMMGGSLELIFTPEVGDPIVIHLQDAADSVSNPVTITPNNISLTPEVTGSSASAIPAGTYDISISYRDFAENAAATATIPGIDIHAPVRTSHTIVSGQVSSAYLAQAGIKLENSPANSNSQNKTCPTDQILSFPVNIKKLQAHLARLGFNPGPIDGINGKMTIGAVKQLQAYFKVATDGVVGPITRGLINNSCN